MPIEDFQSIEGVRIQGERERARARDWASKDRPRVAYMSVPRLPQSRMC